MDRGSINEKFSYKKLTNFPTFLFWGRGEAFKGLKNQIPVVQLNLLTGKRLFCQAFG